MISYSKALRVSRWYAVYVGEEAPECKLYFDKPSQVLELRTLYNWYNSTSDLINLSVCTLENALLMDSVFIGTGKEEWKVQSALTDGLCLTSAYAHNKGKPYGVHIRVGVAEEVSSNEGVLRDEESCELSNSFLPPGFSQIEMD